ncbi:MAG: VWA domain-containing protein [Sphingobacteriia bacterium]|nr:VWA domain-containing protein [Sphingobacteriia bacterium]NCC40403.1 VWA domain-containing protein [Gammaproteobacteria bacterium]
MSPKRTDLQSPASENEISTFLRQVAATPRVGPRGQRGRLIFAMDATASREPTWDQAARIQSSMFLETRDLGGLEVQLCYYRGFLDFAASPWLQDSDALLKRMNRVQCEAGLTQIARVLEHAIGEAERGRVNALVFIGDCMEESRDQLADLAGRLGLIGVPVFVFQEGRDPTTERCFREIARLSGGAWCPFDASSPRLLHELLAAVAVFAAGGRQALIDHGRAHGGAALRLTHQIAPKEV